MPENGVIKYIPTGVILTGGLSTRFGEDKANAIWRGRRLIDHVAARLRTVCRPLIAVARNDQPTHDWPVDRVVFDEPNLPAGPLRGIVSGLKVVEAPCAIVVSCDAPLAQPPLLRALLDTWDATLPALIPRWDGRLQPLVGLYAKSSESNFRRMLLDGEQSPTRALNRLKAKILDEAFCEQYDPHGLSFLSGNSRDALAALEDALPYDAFEELDF